LFSKWEDTGQIGKSEAKAPLQFRPQTPDGGLKAEAPRKRGLEWNIRS